MTPQQMTIFGDLSRTPNCHVCRGEKDWLSKVEWLCNKGIQPTIAANSWIFDSRRRRECDYATIESQAAEVHPGFVDRSDESQVRHRTLAPRATRCRKRRQIAKSPNRNTLWRDAGGRDVLCTMGVEDYASSISRKGSTRGPMIMAECGDSMTSRWPKIRYGRSPSPLFDRMLLSAGLKDCQRHG